MRIALVLLTAAVLLSLAFNADAETYAPSKPDPKTIRTNPAPGAI